MIVLLSDPRVAQIPIRECDETLADVRATAPLRVAARRHGGSDERLYLRSGVVDRLVTAQSLLPRDVRLLVVDGYRPALPPCHHPTCAIEEARLSSSMTPPPHPDPSVTPPSEPAGRCAIPPAVAPHPTGGAVDLTLSTVDRDEPSTGTVALPACCAGAILPASVPTWQLLSSALTAAGLVNYPARWWHWSYGDRFWAFVTRAPHARYGPITGPGCD
jgi:D-alanyl-D-alanine dipeptidase